MKWILTAAGGGNGPGGGGTGNGPTPIGRSTFGGLEGSLPLYWQILLYTMLFFAAIGMLVLVRVQLRNRQEGAERVLHRRRRLVAELAAQGYLTAPAGTAPDVTPQEAPQPPARTAADFPSKPARRPERRPEEHRTATKRSRKPRTPA